MAQDVSAEYLAAIRQDFHKIDRVRLVRQGVVIKDLLAHSGTVDADNSADIQRRVEIEVSDPTGQDTPYDLDDITAPFGTEAWVQTGVRRPVVEEVVMVAEDAGGWNAGTRTNMVVSPAGSLVLGFT